MRTGDETVLVPTIAFDDPRVHLLDDIWLLAIFTVLLSIVLPWFISSFEVDLMHAATGLLALGAVHIAFTVVCAPHRPATVQRRRMLAVLHALGIGFLGYTWLHAGGVQNPMFLIVFALPIVSAVFISRFQPYAMAVLAVVVVSLASLAQSPELRWYVNGLSAGGSWIASLFGSDAGSTGGAPFPGFYALLRRLGAEVEIVP